MGAVFQLVENKLVAEVYAIVPMSALYARLDGADDAVAAANAARDAAVVALTANIDVVDGRVDGEISDRSNMGAALADRIGIEETTRAAFDASLGEALSTTAANLAAVTARLEEVEALFPANSFAGSVNEWRLGLMYGQSNDNGFNSGPDLASTFSTTPGLAEYGSGFAGHVLMFNGGMRAVGLATTDNTLVLPKANIGSLVPAHETFVAPHNGDTMGTRLGAQLSESLPGDVGLILSVLGVGSQSIDALSKGTVPYENILKAVRRAKYLADIEGVAFTVPFVCYEQGETGASDYKNKLIKLRADLDADIRAIVGTGQPPLIFYLTQIAVQWSTIPQIVLDQYAVTVEVATRDYFVLAGPKYWGTFTDAIHENNLTQNMKGYLFGEAINTGPTWKPCHMVSAVKAGGNVVVTFDRDIVIDTTNVAAIDHYGFTAFLAGSPLLGSTPGAVSGATKTGAREITLNFVGGAYLDTGDLGQIACAAYSASVATTGANLGPRSNVRGTGSLTKTIGGVSRTIYTGWACHQLIVA